MKNTLAILAKFVLNYGSLIIESLSFLLFGIFKEIFDYIGEWRQKRGYDSDFWDYSLSDEQLYRMALQLPTKK